MKNFAGAARKILVVEDETAIASFCHRVLTAEGFKVAIASNGKVAQEMVEKERYDLCLIDIRLPVMDGKEFYQWLQEKHPQLANRVIFTAGDVTSQGTQHLWQHAARPFLPKPFTSSELRAKIREVLERRKNDCKADKATVGS